MRGEKWLQDVYDYIERNFYDQHLNKIIDLVKQPSVAGTGEGIEECSQMVMDILTDLGCENVHKEYFVYSPVVEGLLKSDIDNAPTIIMYGMYDVQPPEPIEEWTVSPFAGEIKEYPQYGKCVVARGINNSKGPLMCFINAIYSIRQVLGYMPINVLFIVEGEEEMGSKSLAKFVEKHAERLSKCDVVFLNGARQDENGRPMMNLGNKGMLYIDLELKGGDWGGPTEVDQHSMNASWLSNPIWRLVNALATLRDADDNILIEGFYDDIVPRSDTDEMLTDKMAKIFDENMYLSQRLMAKRFIKGWTGKDAIENFIWQPTLNIDGIEGGYNGPATKTVIPYKATAKMDIRLVPNMTANRTLELLQNHFDEKGFSDIKITVRQGSPWAKADPDRLAVKAAFAAMETFGHEEYGAWPIYPGTGPRHLFMSEPVGLPFVTYGLGQGGRIHAPDEWLSIDGMKENEMSCAAYVYYLLKLMGKECPPSIK